MAAVKRKLTDEEEQEAMCLIVSEKAPCSFRWILQRLGWVVDIKCPIRHTAIKQINKYFAEKEHKKYEREHPDEN